MGLFRPVPSAFKMQAAVVWQQKKETEKRGKKEKVSGKKQTSIKSSIVTDLYIAKLCKLVNIYVRYGNNKMV